MVEEAEAKGANAIVAMRFDTSEMGGDVDGDLRLRHRGPRAQALITGALAIMDGPCGSGRSRRSPPPSVVVGAAAAATGDPGTALRTDGLRARPGGPDRAPERQGRRLRRGRGRQRDEAVGPRRELLVPRRRLGGRHRGVRGLDDDQGGEDGECPGGGLGVQHLALRRRDHAELRGRSRHGRDDLRPRRRQLHRHRASARSRRSAVLMLLGVRRSPTGATSSSRPTRANEPPRAAVRSTTGSRSRSTCT